QIDVMSIESVQEVQIVKGILPAEYGGVTGGQVNLISRSGTNKFHGSAFENYQGDAFYARDRFLAANLSKPSVRFNQYGGSLGGPIEPNRAFFFTTYEGYRETAGIRVTGNVPTPSLRSQVLAALPAPETRIGWNRTKLARLDAFFAVTDPNPNRTERNLYDLRVPLINVPGLFSTPSAEIYQLSGTAYSAEQKASRLFDQHLIKVGGRW